MGNIERHHTFIRKSALQNLLEIPWSLISSWKYTQNTPFCVSFVCVAHNLYSIYTINMCLDADVFMVLINLWIYVCFQDQRPVTSRFTTLN